jgi:C4-dicarboxylate-specific signal transduction histidine kinase
LQRAHDELEQRVTERTADLETALETLQTETAERLKVIDEMHKQEQMLLQQSRLAAMGEMINNIAHQWRQPLNTLGLLVQKLPIYFDSPDFTREFLEDNAVKSMNLIQHMSQTINDFRNFFRTDKEMVIFRLENVVSQAVAFIEQSFRELDIRIELDTKECLEVIGYPNEFAQALLNILTNARDALVVNNTAEAKITLCTFKDGGSAVVTVTDNAGGIPDEVIEKIFDPYFTTKGPDNGTGLGLFISRTIIEKNMKGRLSVRNTGNGSEFKIEVAHGLR